MGQGKIKQTEVRIRVQGHLHGLGMTKVGQHSLAGGGWVAVRIPAKLEGGEVEIHK